MTPVVADRSESNVLFGFERAIPPRCSFFKLNEDGTFEDAAVLAPSVYINDNQAGMLSDSSVIKFLREKYGQYVCIMHDHWIDATVPGYQTQKFILGG